VLSAVIALLWPAQAGTYGELIKVVVAAGLAIVAILYPSGKAVVQVYQLRARAAYYAAVQKGAIQSPRSEPSEDVQPQIDAVIQGIKNDLSADGIPYKDLQGEDDPVPIAPRLVQKLANCWNDASVSLAFKMVLLAKAITVAGQSFTKATGLPAPTTWVEVASPQSYWATHQVGCAIHSEGLYHQILMPIRKALQIRDTGSV
jgi:hypothetical protein